MSKKPLKELAKEIIEPVVTELGYELVDIEYKNSGGSWKLIIYIYKEDGILMEDCELVSRTVDPLLDANKGIADRYDFLQVSSPGLDREFKSIADYKRYIGKDIELSLYAPVNGKKKITGLLKDVMENEIVVNDTDGNMKINLKDIGKAKLAIKF